VGTGALPALHAWCAGEITTPSKCGRMDQVSEQLTACDICVLHLMHLSG
jgi:hypothetical protein